jgi:hypothetical protein
LFLRCQAKQTAAAESEEDQRLHPNQHGHAVSSVTES